jgi:hypothetical protein
MHIWNPKTWWKLITNKTDWSLELIDKTHNFSSDYVVAFPFQPPRFNNPADYKHRVTATPDFGDLARHLTQHYSGHVAKKRTAIDKTIERSIFAGRMTDDDPDAVQYDIRADELSARTAAENGTWVTVNYRDKIVASIYWKPVIPHRYTD